MAERLLKVLKTYPLNLSEEHPLLFRNTQPGYASDIQTSCDRQPITSASEDGISPLVKMVTVKAAYLHKLITGRCFRERDEFDGELNDLKKRYAYLDGAHQSLLKERDELHSQVGVSRNKERDF